MEYDKEADIHDIGICNQGFSSNYHEHLKEIREEDFLKKKNKKM